jgi:hypothetical protein
MTVKIDVQFTRYASKAGREFTVVNGFVWRGNECRYLDLGTCRDGDNAYNFASDARVTLSNIVEALSLFGDTISFADGVPLDDILHVPEMTWIADAIYEKRKTKA